MDFRFKIQETKRKGRPIDIIVSDFIVSPINKTFYSCRYIIFSVYICTYNTDIILLSKNHFC